MNIFKVILKDTIHILKDMQVCVRIPLNLLCNDIQIYFRTSWRTSLILEGYLGIVNDSPKDILNILDDIKGDP